MLMKHSADMPPGAQYDDDAFASLLEEPPPRQAEVLPIKPKLDDSIQVKPEAAGTIDRRDHMATARAFVVDQPEKVVTHQGVTHRYDSAGAYIQISPADLAAEIMRWSEGKKDAETEARFKPNRNWRGNVEDAIKAVTHVPGTLSAPCWLDGRKTPPAREIIPCANGLLHIKTRTLLPPTNQFFSLNCLPFDYNPRAPQPRCWLLFVNQIFEGDQEAIDTLQEMFGYILTSDTSQQKSFLIIGPKRSGKGTLARAATSLVGQDNCAAPTLNGLAQSFGTAALIDKQLAVIGDARLSGRADQAPVVERLLSITGEDNLTISRKYLPDVTLRLTVKFMILTNELPRLGDSSGALASRFIILPLQKSFYGQEDHGLTNKLLKELPGIMNWALAGLDRLTKRGHFIQPISGREAMQELEDLSSPISAFVRECCEVRPGVQIECKELYQTWDEWCKSQGRTQSGTLQSLGRDLRASVPGVVTKQVKSCGTSFRVFEGICKAE